MPVFRLDDSLLFPPACLAEPDGILAVGGDLSVPRLLCAYRQGIFPWYTEDEPVLWWFPHPRCVLIPEKLHVPRSLNKILNSAKFTFTVNTVFDQVITGCASVARPGQKGTWILPEMIAAYLELHRAGWAHSIEAWHEGKLSGGLYGLALGRFFFGESMFHILPDASKAAFVWLVRHLSALDFKLVDCQQHTSHLMRFGAGMISGAEFSRLLAREFRLSIDPDARAKAFFKV
jgi:leucyl/phenylalanyl-tRNA--protein transferase